MNEIPEKPIIQGIAKIGKAFRPSRRAERLGGVVSVFAADQQIRYSQHVRPIMMDGVSVLYWRAGPRPWNHALTALFWTWHGATT